MTSILSFNPVGIPVVRVSQSDGLGHPLAAQQGGRYTTWEELDKHPSPSPSPVADSSSGKSSMFDGSAPLFVVAVAFTLFLLGIRRIRQ